MTPDEFGKIDDAITSLTPLAKRATGPDRETFRRALGQLYRLAGDVLLADGRSEPEPARPPARRGRPRKKLSAERKRERASSQAGRADGARTPEQRARLSVSMKAAWERRRAEASARAENDAKAERLRQRTMGPVVPDQRTGVKA